MIKAIIMDLDGTLLHSDKTISACTLGVLAHCRAKGIKLFIATARPLRDIQQYMDAVRPDGVSAMNGAAVLCG